MKMPANLNNPAAAGLPILGQKIAWCSAVVFRRKSAPKKVYIAGFNLLGTKADQEKRVKMPPREFAAWIFGINSGTLPADLKPEEFVTEKDGESKILGCGVINLPGPQQLEMTLGIGNVFCQVAGIDIEVLKKPEPPKQGNGKAVQ